MRCTPFALATLLAGVALSGLAQARPGHSGRVEPSDPRAARTAVRPVDDFHAHRSPPPLTRTVIRAYLPRATNLPIYNEPPPLR